MPEKLIRVGSRTSTLAWAQAQTVIDALQKQYPTYSFRLLGVKTSGDRDQSSNLSEMGGVGVFTKELETALLNNEIDLAVHSMKDLPGQLPEGLTLGAVGWRQEVHDVLVSINGYSLESLPSQAKVGTGSVRRRAQLLRVRPDLDVVSIRGNLETRLAQLETGRYDALILAAAGLLRLQLDRYPRTILPVDQFLPAVGQGALAIEIRANDAEMAALLQPLDDPEVRAAITAERALMQELSGGCQAPMAALGTMRHGVLSLQGAVFNPDGSRYLNLALSGCREEAQHLGEQMAQALLAQGAGALLKG